jgi:hypothetical protein
MYRMNAAPLRAIHDWVGQYEAVWNERFAHLDAVLDDLKAEELERQTRQDGETNVGSTGTGSTDTGRP